MVRDGQHRANVVEFKHIHDGSEPGADDVKVIRSIEGHPHHARVLAGPWNAVTNCPAEL